MGHFKVAVEQVVHVDGLDRGIVGQDFIYGVKEVLGQVIRVATTVPQDDKPLNLFPLGHFKRVRLSQDQVGLFDAVVELWLGQRDESDTELRIGKKMLNGTNGLA